MTINLDSKQLTSFLGGSILKAFAVLLYGLLMGAAIGWGFAFTIKWIGLFC